MMRRGRRREWVGFGLVFVLSWMVVVVGQEVAPRPSGGVIGFLSLPEMKERQEEVMLHQWKQGMDEAAEFVVETLNENLQRQSAAAASHTPAKGKGAAVPTTKQYELDRLEYEKSGVFRAVMYSLQLRIGRNYLPFSFVSKLTPRFSWLEPVAASEQEELSRDGTIPSVTLRGPIELYMTHAREVDLRVPHSTDIGLVKKITLGEGVNVTVTGLTSMELVGPMDISVDSRDPSASEEGDEGTEHRPTTPQIVLKWNSTPKLRLQFGYRALITSTGGQSLESPRLKVKRVTKDSIEIVNPATLVIPPQGVSKKPAIFGELPLDPEDSKTFWHSYQLHAKRFLPNSDPSASQISIDNLHIVAGKAEAVLGFWVSLRLEESEEDEDGQWLSPEEVKASGLTPLHSHWKALAIATVPEQYQPIRGDIDATGLAHFNQGSRGRAGAAHKHYEWKGITTLYKLPSSVPEVTLEPGMLTQRNETLGMQLEELKGLLGTSNILVGTEPRPPL